MGKGPLRLTVLNDLRTARVVLYFNSQTTQMEKTKMTTINRFYVHNGPARASLAIQHDTSGIVLLATSFATTKRDANGRIDIYSKKNARLLLDARFEDYMSLAVAGKGFPPLMLTPGVFFVGIYDGDKTKNDIFGPMIDLFNTLTAKRNVEETNSMLHSVASSLLIIANHHIANTDRRTLKRQEEELAKQIKILSEHLRSMMQNEVRDILTSAPSNAQDNPSTSIGLDEEYDRIVQEENEQYEKELADKLASDDGVA